MKYFLYILLLAFLVSSFSCRKEKNKTNWDVDVLAPLAKARLTLSDLVSDTLTQVNPDNSVSLIYQNHLYTFTLDSLFEIPDTTIIYSVKLDNLDLGTISLDHRVSFGDIANMDLEEHGPTGGLYEAIMTAHNTGNPAVIDPVEQQTYDSIAIDATQYLQSATVIDGYVDIKINNQLPVDITNVIFEVRNAGGGAILLQDTFPLVQHNHLVSHTKSLAGKTINGSMEGKVTLESPGSGGIPISIDTAMALTASIVVRDLKLSSATAIFPDQDIVSNAEETSFTIDDIQLNRVDVKEGSVTIQVYNTLPESMHYHYKIPSAKLAGLPLDISGSVPAAQPGNPSHTTIIRDLAGYHLDLRGIGPVEAIQGDLNGNGIVDADTVNSLYHQLVAGIDSSGNLTTLTLNDSVYVNCYFSGIVPEYAQGYLGHQHISQTASADLTVLNDITIDQLSLDDIKVALEISNQIGVTGSVKVNHLIAGNNSTGQQVSLTGSAIQNPFTIDKPYDPLNSNIDVVPLFNTLYLDNTNSNVNNLVSILPDHFDYDISVETNLGVTPPVPGYGTDFIYYGDKLNADINVEVPLSLIATNLVLSDTVDISISESNVENINDGSLVLYAYNGYPVEALVQAYLLTEQGQVIDSLFSHYERVSAGVVNLQTNRVQQPAVSRLTVLFDDNKLHRLTIAKKLRVVAKFNTIPQTQHVRIYSDYSIEVHLVGDFGYHVE